MKRHALHRRVVYNDSHVLASSLDYMCANEPRSYCFIQEKASINTVNFKK